VAGGAAAALYKKAEPKFINRQKELIQEMRDAINGRDEDS
jgi:hypothetical protein